MIVFSVRFLYMSLNSRLLSGLRGIRSTRTVVVFEFPAQRVRKSIKRSLHWEKETSASTILHAYLRETMTRGRQQYQQAISVSSRLQYYSHLAIAIV